MSLTIQAARRAGALAAVRDLTRSWAQAHQAEPAAVDDLLTVVGELAGNAVLHARGESFEVTLGRHGPGVAVAVTDDGPAPRPDCRNDGEHGRGLALVARLTRHLEVRLDPDGGRVQARLSLTTTPQRDVATLRDVPGP